MPKRFTDTGLWQKEWFLKYTMKQKLLLRFLYDNCDNAGVYDPNYSLLRVYIGEEVTESDIISLNTNKEKVRKLPNGKFYLMQFIKFQQGNFLNPKNNAHKQIIQLLKENGITLEKALNDENEELLSPYEAPNNPQASPLLAPSKPLNSPYEAPNNPQASPPSNSNSLGNSLGKTTEYLTNNNLNNKNDFSKNLNESEVVQCSVDFGKQVRIGHNFKINFDDEFFNPYRHASPDLAASVESWLIKNKLGNMVDKSFICKQIANFAKKQGKYNELLGD